MNIDGQLIYSGDFCEGNYFYPININSQYYVSPNKDNRITILTLKTIINGDVHVNIHGVDYVITFFIKTILMKFFHSLSPLFVSPEEHDNTMDKKTIIEALECEISVPTHMNDHTYYYNDVLWDYI